MLFFVLLGCVEMEQPKMQTNPSFTISDDISNQQINSFAEDELGHVWIGTARGANKHNVYEFHQYFSNNDSLSLNGNQITQIFRDSKNRLWFCSTAGVCIYTDKDCFKRIKIETQTKNAVQILEDKQGRILLNMIGQLCEYDEKSNLFRMVIPDFDSDGKWTNRCFIDSKGDLWSISGSYIRCFDTKTKQLKSRTNFGSMIHYAFLQNNDQLWIASGVTLSIFDVGKEEFVELPNVISRHKELSQTITSYIHAYSDSQLLISTDKGLFLYDCLSQTLIHQSEDGFPFVAPNFRIKTMFTDSHKNLWIGSNDQGFVVKYSYQERLLNNSYLVSQFDKKSVTSITADHDNNLWLTTSFNGIFFYDARKKNVQPIDVSAFFPDATYYKNFIRSIFIDSENNIWLIPELGRLIKCRFDGNRLQRIDSYPLTPITAMTEDGQGTVYAIGFNRNLHILRKGERTFQQYALYDPDIYVFTSAMIRLADGSLCISSFAKNMLIINSESWEIEEIDIQKLVKKQVLIPTVVLEDSHGDIWIGTLLNGLFRYQRRAGIMEAIAGTACDDIAAIQEDLNGNIWISTLFGLSKYDRLTGQIFNYYKNDGIGGNQFNERSACRMPDGALIFGGTHGLTFFNPTNVFDRRCRKNHRSGYRQRHCRR